MRHPNLKQAVTTIAAALALVALAAPAADARKPAVEPSQPPPADLFLPPITPQPIDPMEPIDPIYCICLPPMD
jgi:hypothetical protein